MNELKVFCVFVFCLSVFLILTSVLGGTTTKDNLELSYIETEILYNTFCNADTGDYFRIRNSPNIPVADTLAKTGIMYKLEMPEGDTMTLFIGVDSNGNCKNGVLWADPRADRLTEADVWCEFLDEITRVIDECKNVRD